MSTKRQSNAMGLVISSLSHLQQKPEPHVLLFLFIWLPHHIVGAPQVVGQIEGHALGEIWLSAGVGECCWLSWADQGSI